MTTNIFDNRPQDHVASIVLTPSRQTRPAILEMLFTCIPIHHPQEFRTSNDIQNVMSSRKERQPLADASCNANIRNILNGYAMQSQPQILPQYAFLLQHH